MRSSSSLSLSFHILKGNEEAEVEWASVLERVSSRGRAFLVAEKSDMGARKACYRSREKKGCPSLKGLLLSEVSWCSSKEAREPCRTKVLLFGQFRTRLEAELGVAGFIIVKVPRTVEVIPERILRSVS
jgi:hypothetical protein